MDSNLEVPYMIAGIEKLHSAQIARFISSIPSVNVAAQGSPTLAAWQAEGLMPKVRGGLLVWRCSVAMGRLGGDEGGGQEMYVGFYGGRMRLGQAFQSVGSMACAGPIGAATLGPRFKDAENNFVEPSHMRLLAIVASDVRESANRGAFYIHKGVPIAAYSYRTETYANIDYSKSYAATEIEMTRTARASAYGMIDPLALIGA